MGGFQFQIQGCRIEHCIKEDCWALFWYHFQPFTIYSIAPLKMDGNLRRLGDSCFSPDTDNFIILFLINYFTKWTIYIHIWLFLTIHYLYVYGCRQCKTMVPICHYADWRQMNKQNCLCVCACMRARVCQQWHTAAQATGCVYCKENLLFNYLQRKHWNIITLCFSVFLHDWVRWHFGSSAALPSWWMWQVRWRPLLLPLLLMLMLS